MNFFDWLIVVVPILFVIWVSFYSRKYVHGVVDYLAAGRVAGRYVLTAGDIVSGLGLITMVALLEMYYCSGVAYTFWNVGSIVIATVLSLTGFCTYRFRRSKALSNGQLLEMRYSRRFRILASMVRITVELLGNGIAPAVSARFFIYFFGIPNSLSIFGWQVSTFALMVGGVLVLALLLVLPSGRIGLVITDAIQGLMTYPIFIILAGYVMYKFSWSEQIVPVMMERVPGQSMLNPFDISQLRDFNLVMVLIWFMLAPLNRAAWIGNDSSTSGRNPHEQKMAGVLGAWRSMVSMLAIVMLAFGGITLMTHADFAGTAHDARQELAVKVAADVAPQSVVATAVTERVRALPPKGHRSGIDAPLSQKHNPDTQYLDAAKEGFGDSPEGNDHFQKFRTLYRQMIMAAGFRHLLPPGIIGFFCLLCVLFMVTTDDSRLMNASTAIMQDFVVPVRKTALSPEQHVRWLRLTTIFVAVFFFFISFFLSQFDYIQMFLIILVSLWLGCAGPVIIFGLYSRFGNTWGAYGSLIFGSGSAVGGVLLQQNWAARVYPILERYGWVEPIGSFLTKVSSPLNPYVVWEMNPVKFPINSYELSFISAGLGIAAYVVFSLVTSRGEIFNLDRMLHRGKYDLDGDGEVKERWTLRNVFGKLIGVTPDYTLGDKVIAWMVFCLVFVVQLGILFLVVAIWNVFSPWPKEWWSGYYFYYYYIMMPALALATAIWFSWGGIRDLFQLLRDLEKRVDNPLDDGRVEGHVSLMDIPLIGSDVTEEKKDETMNP